MVDIQWATVGISAVSAIVVSIITTTINGKIKERKDKKANKVRALNLARTIREELWKNYEYYRIKSVDFSLIDFLEQEHGEMSAELVNRSKSHYMNNSFYKFKDDDWKKISGEIAINDIELFREIDWVYQRITFLKNRIDANGIRFSDLIGQDVFFRGLSRRLTELYSKLED